MNKKVSPPPVPTPESLEDAAKYYRRISLLLRQIREEEDTLNAEVEKLRTASERRAVPKQQEVVGLARSIYAYAHKNRAALTEDDRKKTIEVGGTGIMQWYITPAAVTFDKDIKAEDVLESIKRLKLKQFIRTKEEIDKEAMIADQDLANTIDGVTVKQSEKFAIRPIGSELRVEYNLGSKRWKITEKEKEK